MTMMKMKYLYIVLIGVFLYSCNDEFESPSVDLQKVKLTGKVGEAVEFDITSNAEIISFYSGESGKQYSRRDSIFAPGKQQLSFSSVGAWGGWSHIMSLWMSKDYVGIDSVQNVRHRKNNYLKGKRDSLENKKLELTSEQVEAKLLVLEDAYKVKYKYKTSLEYFNDATWEQIPDVKFGHDDDKVVDEVVDLTPYSDPKAKKVTLAFRMKDGSTHGNYYIKNYEIQVTSDAWEGGKTYRTNADGYENLSILNMGRVWEPDKNGFKIEKGDPWWNSDHPMDTYLLNFPVDLTQTRFPIPGDRGKTISTYVDDLSEYEYVYGKAGTYEATFVFTNTDKDGNTKSVAKIFEVTISE